MARPVGAAVAIGVVIMTAFAPPEIIGIVSYTDRVLKGLCGGVC